MPLPKVFGKRRIELLNIKEDKFLDTLVYDGLEPIQN
jgi:hypothetical protein